MGWLQINTWGRIITPDTEPIWLEAAPWCPATNGPLTGEAVYVSISEVTDLDTLKGKLKGKIVLLGAIRTTPDLTDPLFHRYTAEELAEMETYPRATVVPEFQMCNNLWPTEETGRAAGRSIEDDDR